MKNKTLSKILILFSILISSILFLGCSNQYLRNAETNETTLAERCWITRCVWENVMVVSSHDGKLPLNISKVDVLPDKLVYRSGIVLPEHVPHLQKIGIQSIVTLSNIPEETESLIKNAGINHVEFRFSASRLTVDGINSAIDKILELPGPILVHCRAGADRTGMVIAGLRIRLGETNKDKLLSEMKKYCHVQWEKYHYYNKLLIKLIEIQNKHKQ